MPTKQDNKLARKSSWFGRRQQDDKSHSTATKMESPNQRENSEDFEVHPALRATWPGPSSSSGHQGLGITATRAGNEESGVQVDDPSTYPPLAIGHVPRATSPMYLAPPLKFRQSPVPSSQDSYTTTIDDETQVSGSSAGSQCIAKGSIAEGTIAVQLQFAIKRLQDTLHEQQLRLNEEAQLHECEHKLCRYLMRDRRWPGYDHPLSRDERDQLRPLAERMHMLEEKQDQREGSPGVETEVVPAVFAKMTGLVTKVERVEKALIDLRISQHPALSITR